MNGKVILVLVFSMVTLFFTKANFTDSLDAFAIRIEESIMNSNPMYLNQCFDYKTFLNKIKYLEKPEYSEFNKGFREGLNENFSPGRIVIDELLNNGSFTYLGIKKTNKGISLLFRIFNSSGINYHEYSINKNGSEFYINDIYIYNNYNYLSCLFNDLYTETLYMSFGIKDNIYSDFLHAKMHLLNNIEKGKYKKAYKSWQVLPNEIKINRQILLLAIKASGNTEPADLTKTLNIYNSVNENDQRIYLLPVEDLINSKEYTKAFEYIEKFSLTVNYDPFLNYYRASMLRGLGNTQKAEWVFNNMITEMPKEQSGYFGLLELYIEELNYKNATDLLSRIETNFGLYKKDLSALLINYYDFQCSNEFKNWYEN